MGTKRSRLCESLYKDMQVFFSITPVRGTSYGTVVFGVVDGVPPYTAILKWPEGTMNKTCSFAAAETCYFDNLEHREYTLIVTDACQNTKEALVPIPKMVQIKDVVKEKESYILIDAGDELLKLSGNITTEKPFLISSNKSIYIASEASINCKSLSISACNTIKFEKGVSITSSDICSFFCSSIEGPIPSIIAPYIASNQSIQSTGTQCTLTPNGLSSKIQISTHLASTDIDTLTPNVAADIAFSATQDICVANQATKTNNLSGYSLVIVAPHNTVIIEGAIESVKDILIVAKSIKLTGGVWAQGNIHLFAAEDILVDTIESYGNIAVACIKSIRIVNIYSKGGGFIDISTCAQSINIQNLDNSNVTGTLGTNGAISIKSNGAARIKTMSADVIDCKSLESIFCLQNLAETSIGGVCRV